MIRALLTINLISNLNRFKKFKDENRFFLKELELRDKKDILALIYFFFIFKNCIINKKITPILTKLYRIIWHFVMHNSFIVLSIFSGYEKHHKIIVQCNIGF